MPNKELVGRIELAFIWISRKYRSKGGDAMPSTQAVRGQFGGCIYTTQHGKQWKYGGVAVTKV